LRRYAAGDEEAFQELMSRYRDSVYAFLSRFLNRSDLIEDVFQETFLQLFVSRNTFDVSRPLRPWLFTIAAACLVEHGLGAGMLFFQRQLRESGVIAGPLVDTQHGRMAGVTEHECRNRTVGRANDQQRDAMIDRPFQGFAGGEQFVNPPFVVVATVNTKIGGALRGPHRHGLQMRQCFGNMFDNDESTMDDVINTLDHDEQMPHDELIRNERAASVKRVISRMPAKLREIIVLAYFHKFAYAEIAQILNVPVGTVKSRLHTAVGRFAEDWEDATLCEMAN